MFDITQLSANETSTVELVGGRSNRAGIGTRIAVHVATPAGPRTIRVTAGSGGSFGASSLQQEIGLGDATAIGAVEVRWPSGRVDRWRDLALDRKYRLEEGAPLAVAPERSWPIDAAPRPGHLGTPVGAVRGRVRSAGAPARGLVEVRRRRRAGAHRVAARQAGRHRGAAAR